MRGYWSAFEFVEGRQIFMNSKFRIIIYFKGVSQNKMTIGSYIWIQYILVCLRIEFLLTFRIKM